MNDDNDEESDEGSDEDSDEESDEDSDGGADGDDGDDDDEEEEDEDDDDDGDHDDDHDNDHDDAAVTMTMTDVDSIDWSRRWGGGRRWLSLWWFQVMFDVFSVNIGRVGGWQVPLEVNLQPELLPMLSDLPTCLGWSRMPPEVHSPIHIPFICPSEHRFVTVAAVDAARSLQILGDQTEASLRKAVVGTAFTVLVMMLATWAAQQWLSAIQA